MTEKVSSRFWLVPLPLLLGLLTSLAVGEVCGNGGGGQGVDKAYRATHGVLVLKLKSPLPLTSVTAMSRAPPPSHLMLQAKA